MWRCSYPATCSAQSDSLWTESKSIDIKIKTFQTLSRQGGRHGQQLTDALQSAPHRSQRIVAEKTLARAGTHIKSKPSATRVLNSLIVNRRLEASAVIFFFDDNIS